MDMKGDYLQSDKQWWGNVKNCDKKKYPLEKCNQLNGSKLTFASDRLT